MSLTLNLKRNPAWKPNGPMDYARSARKWSIAPTEQTTFFVHQNKLMRRSTEPPSPSRRRRSSLIDSFRSILPGQHHKRDSIDENGTEGKVDQSTVIKVTDGTEVPALDVQNDLEYVVPVTIGTPGVTVNLDFDTGLSDLWVWSSLLKSSTANLKNHNIYDPSKSTTAKKKSGLTWQMTVDAAYAGGTVYSDIVKLGDDLLVPDQAVEAANKLSSTFLSDNSSDGLFGLGFPSINMVSPTQQLPPVANMIAQGFIMRPIFTVKLNKGDSEGFYTFGHIDETVTPNPITYAKIDSSHGFWEFESPELKVGDKLVTRPEGNTAVADTGTTLILVDDEACQAIYESIPGAKLDHQQGGWVIPSDVATTDLPSLSFSVAGTFYTIPGEDLMFADVGNGTSFGSVQSRGLNPQDILGDVFFKRVYAIFDQTPNAPAIGFAER